MENTDNAQNAVTVEEDQELETLLQSPSDMLAQQGSSASHTPQMITPAKLGQSPKKMYSNSSISDIVEKMELLRKGVESYILETKGEAEAYKLVKKQVTVEEPREVPCERNLDNLYGILWGWPEMIRGRTETKMVKGEKEVVEKIPLAIGELREKLEQYTQAYLTELNKYVGELNKMCTNIDNSLTVLETNREDCTENAKEALKKGKQMKDHWGAIKGKKEQLKNDILSVSRADDNYVKIKNALYKLKKNMGEAELLVSEFDGDDVWYSNSERLLGAYEETLSNVRGVGSAFAKRIERHVGFIDNLLYVSRNTNEVVETIAESIKVIGSGIDVVVKLADYSNNLYNIALEAATAMGTKDNEHIINAENMVENARQFGEQRSQRFLSSCDSIEQKIRPKNMLGTPASVKAAGAAGPSAGYNPGTEQQDYGQMDLPYDENPAGNPGSNNGAPTAHPA